jgi:hypothetical protein
MSETAGMRALVDFEDAAQDLLGEKLPGIDASLWPLARWPVSVAIAATDIGTGAPTFPRQPLRVRMLKTARRLTPNPRSADRAPRAEDLFVVSGWTKAPTSAGYENWLVEDFARARGDRAIVVQDAFLDLLSRGDQVPALARTYSYARANERVGRATARKPLPEAARARIAEFVATCFDRIDFDVPEAARTRAIDDVVGRADRAAASVDQFRRLLDRVQPRRIYMQTAAYGSKSPLIREAHRRGIGVAEPQHGWIGSSHAAYNFGAAMSHGELREHLPDTLLTFGEFWGRGIRFPGRVVPIGKPALDRASRAAAAYDDRPRRVLFVSTRFAYERVEEVVLALRDALPDGWTVAVRPHPSERARIRASLPRLQGQAGIEFDESSDAGASLANSRAVVGFSSTMLYEALAYGCHVAVVESAMASAYADASVFPLRIDDSTDLSELVAAVGAAPRATERAFAEAVWHPDPVASFVAEADRPDSR